jgi:NDP-sugar pyrophosphorylase family protein
MFEEFFELDVMHPRKLFDGVSTLWEPLDRLIEYIEAFNDWGIYSHVPSFAHLENEKKIFIGKNVKIEPGAFIKGPCIIESGATISHCSLVRPYSIIGPLAVVGHCSEVKSSILLEGAKLAHFNYVGDSIIGSSVNLGAGAICANIRLDKGDVSLKIRGNRLQTGRKKLGSIIGDGASVACSVVLNPGTTLFSNTLFYKVTK